MNVLYRNLVLVDYILSACVTCHHLVGYVI